MPKSRQESRYPNGWWIIALSDEVPNGKPRELIRFGRSLALWRSDEGTLHAVDNLCPHRFVKLSQGRVRDNCLECPFHGFRFSGSGECTLIPETGKPAPGIRVRSYPVRESDRYIWLWWTDEDEPSIADRTPPFFEETRERTFSSWNYAMDQACHVTRAIENQIDTAHLAFVHATTIGRGADPKARRRVVSDANGIQIDLGNETDQIPYIRLIAPNYWMNVIHRKFIATLAFAPVDENHVRLYLRTHQRFLVFPVLGRFFAWTLSLFNQVVLNQDKRVVESHPRGFVPDDEREEKLIGSDLAIREFRKWWAKGTQASGKVSGTFPEGG